LTVPRISEKTEQAHIVQLLRSIGAAVYVMGVHRRRGDYAGTMQTEGIPDLMAFLPARGGDGAIGARVFLFIECKAKGGRLRPEQAAFREHCLNADVIHRVGGYDDLIAWLADRDYVKASAFPHYRQPGAAR
jgi:hypothetical protein